MKTINSKLKNHSSAFEREEQKQSIRLRPINEEGIWGAMCRKEYLLDENDQRIPNGKGGWKIAVLTPPIGTTAPRPSSGALPGRSLWIRHWSAVTRQSASTTVAKNVRALIKFQASIWVWRQRKWSDEESAQTVAI